MPLFFILTNGQLYIDCIICCFPAQLHKGRQPETPVDGWNAWFFNDEKNMVSNFLSLKSIECNKIFLI